MKRKNFLAPLALVMLISMSFIHVSKAEGDNEFGVFGGVSHYIGDMEQSRVNFEEYNPAGGLFYRYYYDPRFNLKTGIYFGHVSGDDMHYEELQERGLNFRSPVLEGNMLLEWNILPFVPNSQNNRFSPYVFTGIALFYYAPEGTHTRLKEAAGQAMQRMDYAIPMGAGFKYNISEFWNIGFETGVRKTFTDYLDGVSQRGNPDTHDWYAFTGLTFSYTLRCFQC